MANTAIILCDTNIIIEFYKENEAIINELKHIGQDNIAVSVVTIGELIYGAFNKKELTQILRDAANLHLFQINDAIGNKFIELMSNFSLSHNLTLPDALIAATALHYDVPIYTLNIKDFRFIPDLKLYN